MQNTIDQQSVTPNTNTMPVQASPNPVISQESPPVPPSFSPHGGAGKQKLMVAGICVVALVVIGSLGYWLTRRSSSPGLQTTTSTQSLIMPKVVAMDREGAMTLSPATVRVQKGQTATLTLSINAQGSALDGADAVLSYNPELLDVTVQKGTAFPIYLKNYANPQTKKIYVTGVTLDQSPAPSSSTLTLATLTITGKKAGSGKIDILWNEGEKNLSTLIETKTSNTVLGDVSGSAFTVTE